MFIEHVNEATDRDRNRSYSGFKLADLVGDVAPLSTVAYGLTHLPEGQTKALADGAEFGACHGVTSFSYAMTAASSSSNVAC